MQGDLLQLSVDQQISQTKLILRPLIGLMSGQSRDEIEWYCLKEMEKHRRLRDEAVTLEAAVADAANAEEASQCMKAFIPAMIAVHAQHTVVSTLLDILGYIPDACAAKAH